jgi:hypothetical protein
MWTFPASSSEMILASSLIGNGRDGSGSGEISRKMCEIGGRRGKLTVKRATYSEQVRGIGVPDMSAQMKLSQRKRSRLKSQFGKRFALPERHMMKMN